MIGVVVSSLVNKSGSALVTAISSGSTTLDVDFGGDFDPDGGQVLVAGHTLTYTRMKYKDVVADAVMVDTLVLSGAAGFSAPKWTPVEIPGRFAYEAQVILSGSTLPVTAMVGHALKDDASFTPEAVSDGARVEVEKFRGGYVITDILERAPSKVITMATIVGDVVVTGTLQLKDGGRLADQTSATLMDSADAGSFPSTISSLDTRVTILEGTITGGTLAYIDGGLNGSTAYAYVDGGLYT